MMRGLAVGEVFSMRVFPLIRLVVLILLLALTTIPTGRGAASPGITHRVSVDREGNQANRESFSPALSADRRFVAFRSDASNLVPGDTSSAEDAFARVRHTGVTQRV